MRAKKLLAVCTAQILALAVPSPLRAGDDAAAAAQTVSEARTTLANFLSDPDMKWVRSHFPRAKAVMIVPVQGKGGFIFAGSGGVGVLLVKDAKGNWSQPAFYKLAAVSVGLQAGGEKSEVLFFIQSQKGVDSFLSKSFKLGAEASVAAGPVGQGAKASSADVLSFSRSKGAFAGASFDGTSVKPAEDLNKAFYNKPASPVDILVRGTVENEGAKALREDLAKVGAKKK